MAIQRRRMRVVLQPLAASPEVEEIDSGRFEMKTATR